jgi:hypothetical protein
MTQAQQDAFQAAQSMAAAGVTGLGGGQQQPGAQGSFTLTDPSTGQTNTYTTNNQGTTFTTNQAGQTTHINGAPIEPSGIFGGLNLSNFSFPTFGGMGIDFLQTLGINKNEIMYKLYRDPSGSTLTQKEKQAVAGLISAGELNPNVFKDVKYDDEEGKFSIAWEPEEVKGAFQTFFDKKYGKLADTAEEYYEKLVDEYETGKPTGFGGIFGVGEGRTEGLTGEEVQDMLDPEDRHWMKVNRPDLYYRINTPQTSGGIADLAGQQLMSTEGLGGEDLQRAKDFNQQVFNARNELDRQWGDGGQGGGQEVASMPTFTDVNNNGILDYLETAETGTTGTGITGTSAGNQLAFASPGKIGYMTPEGYQWGTTGEYSPYAEVNLQNIRNGGIVGLYNGGYLNNSNGVIGLDGGGYLDDYKAADSLMFKDPQEDEEWEYNV